MSDMYLGSQAPLYQNVKIRVFNQKTGHVRIERNVKNRVTKLMLWGIAQFLSGAFNDSTPDKIYEYIPRYIALGSCIPGPDAQTAGVSTTVTVNDSRLLNEYKYISSNGRSEPVKRISIQSRQHSKLTTSFNDPFVKLSLSTYVSSSMYDGLEIGEAGLFSKEYDNNCLARVVFPPFKKNEGEVIDIQWEITILSYGNTKYAESVKIEGPGRVVIPITYTPYHIVTKFIGLNYRDNCLFAENVDEPLFTISSDGTISKIKNKEEFVGSKWDNYLQSIDLTLDFVYDNLNGSKYKLDKFQFVNIEDSSIPDVFYLGDSSRVSSSLTFLADNENYLLQDNEYFQLITSDLIGGTTNSQPLLMSSIYEESIEYETKPTGSRLIPTEDVNDYIIELSDGDRTTYKVIDNEIFMASESSSSGYESKNCFLYNGMIVNQDNAPTNYVYDSNGNINEMIETSHSDEDTKTFLAYKYNTSSEYIFGIYKINGLNMIIDTNYWIDWTQDKEVYSSTDEQVDTLYHVTNDNYFAIGESNKLSAYITPSDVTDKSVTWSIINKNISKINQQGVLTAWNVGQTIAVVSTTNNIKSRIEVEVVKNSQLILVEDLSIDPDNITILYTDKEKVVNISAVVKPTFSTYKTVKWSTDAALDAICDFNVLNNNKAQVRLNNSGNVGRGIITATTQDGKSASCLVTVIYESDDKEDCIDLRYHEDQQI